MKHISFLVKVLLLAYLLIFSPFSVKAQQKGKPFTMSKEQAPMIQGIKLGMTEAEAKNGVASLSLPKIFNTSSDGNNKCGVATSPKLNITDKNPLGGSFGSASYASDCDARTGKGIGAALSVDFYDGKAIIVEWTLSPKVWKTNDEMVKYFTKLWKIPESAWLGNSLERVFYSAGSPMLRGFAITLDDSVDYAGRKSSRIRIVDLDKAKILQQRTVDEERRQQERIKP